MSSELLPEALLSFADLNLSEPLQRAIDEAGYESPTPIQAAIIPYVLAGRDVVGQAQTGTGKTAAFALPLLNQLRTGKKIDPQILVLAPTRELALQVAEAFETYGRYLKNFKVAAIFGGQDYAIQLRQLSLGVQVVVGTPGRVMDHIRRGSLNLSTIHSLVLDEGDEMLKMGFIDDVEWILEQAPDTRQIALFSATMPADIRKIAQKYLTDPAEITIQSKTVTATTIHQRYLLTPGLSRKFEALTRILEVEKSEGILIFVRTKVQTVELAEQLIELGYACAALNGDIAQNQRLRTVEQLKSGKLNILVATDVAARGLDVERISHVINYDIPFDTEAYIHRIGRTGRAGRTGEAILFLNPREKQMLKSIERATRQKITEMRLPAIAEINQRRLERFKERITESLTQDCSLYLPLIEEYCLDQGVSVQLAAAGLARMVQGKAPLLLVEQEYEPRPTREYSHQPFEADRNRKSRPLPGGRAPRPASAPESGKDRYRLEVGEIHGVKPGNIVGAIANEADISSQNIGRISIFEQHSTVDLPAAMPPHILRLLQKVRINDRMLKISLEQSGPAATERHDHRPGRGEYGADKKQGFTSAKSTRPSIRPKSRTPYNPNK